MTVAMVATIHLIASTLLFLPIRTTTFSADRSILPMNLRCYRTANSASATFLRETTSFYRETLLGNTNRRDGRSDDDSIRGADKYGIDNNSTISSPTEAAEKVGVKPALEASKKTWQRAWRFQKAALPWLHALDGCRPPDSKLSLACLWWKALSGNDLRSPVYDNRLSYDLLPRGTRWVVSKRMRRFYPRLHHANVEIRTAYLDRAVEEVIASVQENFQSKHFANQNEATNTMKIRLIVMGCGYDPRSFKFIEKNLVDEVYELDLPEVVSAKEKILHSRLLRRRPWLREKQLPILVGVDFNNLKSTKKILEDLLASSGGEGARSEKVYWENVFIFEGVMIYLDAGVPRGLLDLTSEVLRSCGAKSGHLCFADKLENIPGGDRFIGEKEIADAGWELLDWLPKPGLARHMGKARLKIE